MKVLEYDVLNDKYREGRVIPKNHSIQFWLDDHSYIEVRGGDAHGGTLEVRATGWRTQLQVAPVASNTFLISVKKN